MSASSNRFDRQQDLVPQDRLRLTRATVIGVGAMAGKSPCNLPPSEHHGCNSWTSIRSIGPMSPHRAT